MPFAEAGHWQPLLLAEDGRNTNFFDFIGVSPAMDQVLENLFANADLQALLTRVLGTHYRIWYAQIRRAEPAARALRMHHDQPGEVGLSILLSHISSATGTTVFLPRSQRWPRILDSFPFLSPRLFRRFIQGAVGESGDMYLFYNATWHGMTSTDRESRTAIILTFLPLANSGNDRLPPRDVLKKVGPHLSGVMAGDAWKSATPNDMATRSSVGPDDVVGQRIAPPTIFSKWRIPILAAGFFGTLVASYRSLKRRRRSQ